MFTKRNLTNNIGWIIPLIIATVLIVGAARMHELWGDEAETALFARNILKYGIPKGWDGTNIMGINNGIVLNENLINHTSPWAQYYMVAASFALFGQSSFTARLPSIILFIFSIPLLYYVAFNITRKKFIGFLAAIIASLSVQGILFGYQARYYELTSVAGLFFLISAFELGTKKRWPSVFFIFSGIVFFYANYMSWVAYYGAVFVSICCFLWYQKRPPRTLRIFVMRYLLFSLVIAAFCAPWFLAFQPLHNRGELKIDSISDFINGLYQYTLLAWYFFHNSGVFPIGMAVLTSVVVAVRVWQKKSIGVLLTLLSAVFVYLFLMGLFTTVSWVDTVFVQARYTTVLLPVFFLIVAIVIYEIFSWNKLIGAIFVIVYLGTNILMFGPPGSFAWLLAGEIVHPYQTPGTLVARYLSAHAQKGDTAFVNFDSDHEPLIFLLGDTIRFVNRVTMVNTRIFPKNRAIIPRYIYDFQGEPSWVISYGKRPPDGTFYTSDYRQLGEDVDLEHDYTQYVIPLYFADLSRPEIAIRSFTGITSPAALDYVSIYKRKQ